MKLSSCDQGYDNLRSEFCILFIYVIHYIHKILRLHCTSFHYANDDGLIFIFHHREMIPLLEPQRGIDLLQFRNTFVYQTPLLHQWVPFFADIFVFSYPIFLLTRYIYGIYIHNNHYKNQALLIFTSAIVGFLINFIIHLIVDKQRPEIFIVNKSQLLLSHLPTAPFPSDHATVSAAIAVAVLLLAYKTKNHILGCVGGFFAFASLMMGICRVGVAVHWPTDVLVGWMIGIIIGYICVTKQYTFLKKHIYAFLIAFEEQCVAFLTTMVSKK